MSSVLHNNTICGFSLDTKTTPETIRRGCASMEIGQKWRNENAHYTRNKGHGQDKQYRSQSEGGLLQVNKIGRESMKRTWHCMRR